MWKNLKTIYLLSTSKKLLLFPADVKSGIAWFFLPEKTRQSTNAENSYFSFEELFVCEKKLL